MEGRERCGAGEEEQARAEGPETALHPEVEGGAVGEDGRRRRRRGEGALCEGEQHGCRVIKEFFVWLSFHHAALCGGYNFRLQWKILFRSSSDCECISPRLLTLSALRAAND